jgi:hypothetical protein
MKHIALGVIAAVISGTITIAIHVWGAHDMQGFLVAIAGFPGLLANGSYTRLNDVLNDVLFTVVNWGFYFALFEGIVALTKQFSK